MPNIPEYVLHDASTEQVSRFEDLAEKAELRLDMPSGHAPAISGAELSQGPLITLTPLHDDRGMLRTDSAEVLTREAPGVVSEQDASRILAEAERLLARSRGDVHLVTAAQELAFELPRADNPADELSKFIATNESVRFYKVEAAEAFHMREVVWRFLTSSIENVAGMGLLAGESSLPESTAPLGLSSFPADLLAVPLAARVQPLALSVITRRGVHVMGVCAAGAAIRNQHVSAWPVATDSLVFAGSGEEAYSSRLKQIPRDWPLGILDALLSGANVLAEISCNPDYWEKDDGYIDVVERNIFVTSIRLGISALSEAASEWGSTSTLWAAYRALGVLMGLWHDKGSDGAALALRQLLDPRLIQAVAIPRLQPSSYRQWATDVVKHYETEITETMFPGVGLDEALGRLEHTRHLVHGAGPRSRHRAERLRALVGARRGAPIIPDIANFWWTAVVMDPLGMSAAGTAPFPGRK